MIVALLIVIAVLLIGGILVIREDIQTAAKQIEATLKGIEAAIVSLVELEDQKRTMRSTFASGYGRDLLRQRLAERLQAKAAAKKVKA